MEFKTLQWGKSKATEKSKTQSVKLPKLEFMKFNGMVLKWPEFYDAFEAAVDSNLNLSGVDKFNYLCSRLEGDALEVIDGIDTSFFLFIVKVLWLVKFSYVIGF